MDFGTVILFVCAIAGLAVFASLFLPQAAQSYLGVLEGTAAGQDHVTWPDEGWLDSLWKPLFLFWLSSVWFALVWIQFLMVAPGFAKSPIGVFIAAGVAIWLLFPISLLSALSSNSKFMLIYPPLFGRLRPHFGSVLLTYALTGLLVPACGALIFLGLGKRFWVLPVAAFVSMTALLIHARILGRLAWLVYRDSMREVSAAKKEQARLEKDPRHDPFPAPLPKPPQALPVGDAPADLPQAIPVATLPQAIPVHIAEAIKPAARSALPPIQEAAEDDIPEMEVEEVRDEAPAVEPPSILPPLRIPVDDLPPLPIMDETMPVLDLNASLPPPSQTAPAEAVPARRPADNPLADEPGLLPLDLPAPTRASFEEPDPRPYELQEEPKPSWRADFASAQPPPLPAAAPVEGYGLAPEDAPQSKPPLPLDGYWPVGVDRRIDLSDETPRPLDLDRKFNVRAEKPYEPRLTFFQGVFEFPFYPRSLRPLFYLTVLFFFELLFIQIMIWCWPPE